MRQQPGSSEAIIAGSVLVLGIMVVQEFNNMIQRQLMVANIGYTKLEMDCSKCNRTSFRKYIFDAPITSAQATSVEMIVSVDDYSLARADIKVYNTMLGKGMLFRLDSSSSTASVELLHLMQLTMPVAQMLTAMDNRLGNFIDDSTNGQAATGI